jgi:hypothetical protein
MALGKTPAAVTVDEVLMEGAPVEIRFVQDGRCVSFYELVFARENSSKSFAIANARILLRTMEQLSLLEQSRLDDPFCDDRSHVARLAERILNELDASPPVNLAMVASYQGVASVRECALPNAGCLVTEPQSGRVEIRLRAGDNRGRQRFTGFHEVTHTFMPGYRLTIQWRCDPDPTRLAKRRVEQLCDVGASELLFPRRAFEGDLRDAEFGMASVFGLADAYDASVQATGHRVVALWPEDAMLVVAEMATKPHDPGDAQPRLRIKYTTRRGRWPFIPRHKSIDDGQPLSRALAGELIDEPTTLNGLCAYEVDGLEVSARLCPYTDAQGERHDRVLALYRRPASRA